MTEENEKILESCKRYIDAGIYNRNVNLQYKRLTGNNLGTERTGLLGFKQLILNHLWGVLWYLCIGTICVGFAGTMNLSLLAWFDILVITLISFGCFIEVFSLVSKNVLSFYYLEREVVDIRKCKTWLLDILLGKGVIQVSVTDNQLILESCERYIEKNVSNKYVNEYYKKLTETERPETKDKHLISKKYIVFDCIKNTVYGAILAFVFDILFTMFQVYEFVNVRVFVIFGVAIVYAVIRCMHLYLIKPKRYKELSKFNSAYIDYLVGRGYAKVTEVTKDEE